MPVDSNQPKEPKSNLHFIKNLNNRPRSSIKVSDQNTLCQKLVQKSICNFLSCSSYSPHQNPIKIEPRFILKLPLNSNLGPVKLSQNASKIARKTREREGHYLGRGGQMTRKREMEERRQNEREREGFNHE